MPPIRHTEHPQNADSPTTHREPEKRKKRNHAKLKEGAPPGVSKTKSALRQTRRLLAKEGLRADVRIEAERKLKALETDLAAAERANKERALATRYHKVKFFDRQRLLRKIKQTKRRLEDEDISSKVRKALGSELFDLRVDLNYVMNYPKLEKYISLFPPEVRGTGDAATPVHAAASSSITDEKREMLREWVRGKMRTNEMSGEPETLEHRRSVQDDVARRWEGSSDKRRRGAGVEEVEARQDTDAADDFFEGETENEDINAGEPTNVPSVQLPAKRRPEKATNYSDKHSNKHPKEAKRKKHSGEAVLPPTVQDNFFGDGSE